MDLNKVLAQLREELENLDAAILSLERLQQQGRPRGRPPKALSHLSKAARAPRKESSEEDEDVPSGDGEPDPDDG
jgi:hypothetical protein